MIRLTRHAISLAASSLILCACWTSLCQEWKKSGMPPEYLRGSWILTGVAQTNSIESLDQGQQDSLINTKIQYSADRITSCGQALSIASLNVRVIGEKEFFDGLYLTFAQVNVTEDSVKHILINRDQAGNCLGTRTIPGEDVYVRNDRQMVVNFDGTFYFAQKVASD